MLSSLMTVAYATSFELTYKIILLKVDFVYLIFTVNVSRFEEKGMVIQ